MPRTDTECGTCSVALSIESKRWIIERRINGHFWAPEFLSFFHPIHVRDSRVQIGTAGGGTRFMLFGFDGNGTAAGVFGRFEEHGSGG